MRETILARYFDGVLPSELLSANLNDVHGVPVLKKDINFFCDLTNIREVNLVDLRKLGCDYLNGHLSAEDIEAVAFFLAGSDHFEWDKSTLDGAVVAEVIDDWSSPRVAYPISEKNMKMIVRGLDEGVYDTHQLEANRE